MQQFKEGDKVEFVLLGERTTGSYVAALIFASRESRHMVKDRNRDGEWLVRDVDIWPIPKPAKPKMQAFAQGDKVEVEILLGKWREAEYLAPSAVFANAHVVVLDQTAIIFADCCIRPIARPLFATDEAVESNNWLSSVSCGEGDGKPTDNDIHTNAHGGKQSALPYRCDLFPPTAMLKLAEVLAKGATTYGDRNWRLITVNEHLNHATTHILKHHAGDTSEPHLSHAACRMLMALEISLVGMDKEAK